MTLGGEIGVEIDKLTGLKWQFTVYREMNHFFPPVSDPDCFLHLTCLKKSSSLQLVAKGNLT